MTGAGRKEIDFEATIERELIERGGHLRGDPELFDRKLALTPSDFIAFVQGSQPELWAQLSKEHGASRDEGLVDALTKNLSSRGTLDVLRHGFKFYGKAIHVAFFRPAHGMNPELEQQCAQNRVVVTRQVKFNPAGDDSVDMLVSLNGLPIATLELKNPISGQTVEHAKKQYQQDRDPKLPLFAFKTRALVHFAVDPDEVYMTTRLAGRATQFLPFNRGNEGGKGNPVDERSGHRTAYLWREVLARDSLLDLLARFVHVLTEKVVVDGKEIVKESIVFPRYHQLDVVRALVAAAREEGPGKSYLVQHSAGSGKSNSIAWIAHHLASLHDATDQKVFDAVVVVTDRRVLDRQLQDTIYQFEHKSGVVERIDKDSAQLARALERGTPIVVTTLQKFPVVAKRVSSLPTRRYAVIVDEAHSSQSGEAADQLRQVLAAPARDDQEPDELTYEDEIANVMASRGPQKNMSFFAFTATPKAKTLELFGRRGPGGTPVPFHLYSMRQAIEEGFILDVLRNYTTYRAYYKLVQKAAASDPDVKKREATAALARFMSLHPHNIGQKTEVIVEHFRQRVRRKLNGNAKAIVVTRSRLHAIRFKQAFDAYVKEKGYAELRSLVAFSGTVRDPDTGQDLNEVGMNGGMAETELPKRLKTADYQVLIAANKYQTGYDEPLLCAMYVDKRLAGVQAVQTLSRLNRMHPGKETFVLDFVNDADEIRQAFQPYYEQTVVSETADPFLLEELRHKLDEAQVWHASEVEAFAKVFYRPKARLTDNESEELYRHLQPAKDRWLDMKDEDAREKWRGMLDAFVRLYAFVSQVMPWTDRDLEVRATFGRFLLKRLPIGVREVTRLEGEVDLHSYRLARIAETDIALEKGSTGTVKGVRAVGTRKAKDEKIPLHQIIEILNERFGTDFTPADQLLFEQIVADGKADEQVRARAQANSYENFALATRGKIEGLMIDRMDRNQDIVTKFLNEEEFKRAVSELLAKRIYEDLRRTGA